MNPILMTGTSIVQMALISYSVFFYYERRRKSVENATLTFLTIGVTLDLIATVCMVIGSSHGAFTLHGFIGYSSLSGMLIDAVLLWRLRLRSGAHSAIPKKLHLYSLIAYFWWLAAYITGALIVMMRRIA